MIGKSGTYISRTRRILHLGFYLLALGLFFAAACAVPPAPPTTAPPANIPAATVTLARPTLPSATLAAATLTPTARPSSPVSESVIPSPATTAKPTPSDGDWTTYHRDNLRTGYVPGIPDPQKLAVAWTVTLDGAVYAEPLVIGGNVIVATEHDSLYALDVQAGKIVWHTNVGEPVARSALPCGNIDPLGITGTPVYDPTTGLIFAVAEVTGPAHILVGLDARTGEVRVRRSADPDGMQPLAHQQRAALALSQGMVYIAYGGLFGDCGNYHGTVIASRTDGSGALLSYQAPTQREGGIWAAAGPSIDAAGRVYVSVGNGAQVTGEWDHTDSVLRLSPTLQLQDGFAPDQWRQDNLTDADLGSLAPVLLPNGVIFIAGKSGIGYLLDSEKLGGIGGQLQTRPVCHAYGGASIVGSTAFIPCNEGVQQVQIEAGKSFTLGWRADGIPGSPVVGGKTVYSLDRGGTLHALDMETGKARATVRVGATSRFATPTLFGNRIFIGTMTGITAVDAS